MNWRSGAVLLLCGLWMGQAGWGQTKAKPAPAATDVAVKNPFDSFKTFSATLNGGMGRDHDRKIYRSGNLMRADFDNAYRITDMGRGITWGVEPHSCAQFAAPDAGTFPFSAFRESKVERSLATEKETVDGHVCAIETVTFSAKDGSGRGARMKLWEAEDLQHFPIKIEVEPISPTVSTAKKMEITYTNVSLAPPDPNLFKHPAKCTLDKPQQPGTPTPKSPVAAPKPPQKSQ